MQSLISRHPGLSVIVTCITSFILGIMASISNNVLYIFIFICLPLIAVIAIFLGKKIAYFANPETRNWTTIRLSLTLIGSLFVIAVIWISLFISIKSNSEQDTFYPDFSGIVLWIGENIGKGLVVFLEFGVFILIMSILSESSNRKFR